MRLLAIGDVFGRTGRRAIRRWLPELIDETGAGLVVVNVENLHRGSGIDTAGLADVLEAGADLMTTGNHVFSRSSNVRLLDDEERVIRPWNYPPPCPGRGAAVAVSREGVRVGVAQVLGRVFLAPVDDPFRAADEAIGHLSARADVIVLDVHAEATSEKAALAHHVDGRAAAVFGTHTHVQTADARVLPGGTGFITDLGMTGPYDSIIGREIAGILERMRTQRPVRAEPASGGAGLRGALFEIDESTGRCLRVERVVRGEGGR
ncbi:MAG: TIGR00282 family metallophosphoesterase [Acidobacteriota bacterium]|nr:MAG: YmdB family metallophosphoesterase [Acidobacteriota bacterium]